MSIALVGNPNCGKTALFNAMTGGRAKVANYPGVTVEKREGRLSMAAGASVALLDLPGAYSLDAKTPDEEITRDVLAGSFDGEKPPQAVIVVADASNLERSLALVLEVRDALAARKTPWVLALNMMDLAERQAVRRMRKLDVPALEKALGVRAIPTVATKRRGIEDLKVAAAELAARPQGAEVTPGAPVAAAGAETIQARFAEVDRILRAALPEAAPDDGASFARGAGSHDWTDRIDRIVLHPVWGSMALLITLGLVFQAIFAWAKVPQGWIQAGVAALGAGVGGLLPEGVIKSLLVDGVISGVGSVVVFLPQILILFAFILVLEDSGYMARAAFLMDRWMARVGLHGRAFIPLLSSFACAIPGIMATRTIETKRDRLITILISPLMTCSARLPVYALLIATFIPDKKVFGFLGAQGLVMLGLYLGAVVIALLVAKVLGKTVLPGPAPTLLLELPTYKWPSAREVALGLWERAKLFMRRAGTVILSLSILLWFLATYPKAPAGAEGPAIFYSFAGIFGKWIEPLIAPIGFNWRIGIALVPGFAAREVMVSALSTVYAIEDGAGGTALDQLSTVLARDWSLATGLSLLVWYVIACQCLSTLAVTKRETNSWRWPAFMLGYLTVLAYGASWATYHFTVWASA